MKRKLAVALLLLLCTGLCFPVVRAGAEEQELGYARITQENTYLYADAESDSGLFILPQSYFVHITGSAGEYYAVEYLTGIPGVTAVRGYCRADEVTPVDYVPDTPYLVYTLRVTFRTDNNLPDPFISEYDVDAAFYGTFLYGSAVCYYVELEGEFGYVAASACPPLDYPVNTEHTQTEPEPAPQTPQSTFNALNVVLICVLAVVALGAVYFLFRPAKKRRTQEDDEDAEWGFKV